LFQAYSPLDETAFQVGTSASPQTENKIRSCRYKHATHFCVYKGGTLKAEDYMIKKTTPIIHQEQNEDRKANRYPNTPSLGSLICLFL
jgi:hypothetical protein